MPGTDLRATVVVCTCNRSRLLVEACESALAVDFPAQAWELVIVDNRSTDDTLAIAHDVGARHPGRVRVIEELEVGLSAARNAGIAVARGEIVAFLDDDAYPDPTWLRALDRAFEDPNVLAAGGPVTPRYEGSLPDWLTEPYLPYLTVWDLGTEPQSLRYNEYPRGANVAFRRQVFERFGGFSTHLGRKGKTLLSGEETEICLRVERDGGVIRYVPDAGVDHRVHAERITHDWMLARFGAQGRTEAIIDWMHAGLHGLWLGAKRLKSFARNAHQHEGAEAAFAARCHDVAWRAYVSSALRCPMFVRRYRPPRPTPPWVPAVPA